MNNIFNLSVLTENNNIDNIFDMSYVEESYFNTTLKFVKEQNNAIRYHTKQLYKTILENEGNYEVITESFSDFFDKIRNIIKKFLAFIKSLVERFIIALHRFVSSDKYIIKHKKDFSDFKSDYEFDIKGYNYTFDPAIPVIDVVAEFRKDFVGLDFKEMIEKKDDNAKIKYISDLYTKLNNKLNNDYFDEIRKDVIKAPSDISSSDFHEELFACFRDGNNSKETITVDNSYLTNTLISFENYKEHEKTTKQTKDKIEKEYRELEKLIKDIVSKAGSGELKGMLLDAEGKNYTGGETELTSLPKEAKNKIDLYIKTKVNQITQISNIHSLAFSAKLDAISECYKQDKQTLYRALNVIKKKSHKEAK